jgi:hypothetical protein
MIGEEILNLIRGPVLPPGTLGGAPNPSPAAGQLLPQAPGGASGQSAGGGPNGQTTPQSPSNAPQSPPDLAQLYLRLQQRNQSANEIDRGLTTMAAAFSTPAMASQLMGNMPQQQDAGAQLSNVMRLQQMQLQRQQMQSIIGGINSGDLTKQTGVPANVLLTELYTNPTGFGDNINKAIQIKQGYAGPEPAAALVRARNAWTAQNAQVDPSTGQPMPDPNNPGQPLLKPGVTMPNYLTDETKFGPWQKQADALAGDKATAQSDFSSVNPHYDTIENTLEYLNDPTRRDAVIKAIQNPNWFTEDQSGRFIGNSRLGQALTGVTPQVLDAKNKLQFLNNTFYSTEFKGSGRLSQQEASRLNNAFTSLNSPTNSPDAITTELGRLQDQTYQAHANIYGAAGQQIPGKYHGLANPQYLDQNNPIYNGATEEHIPDLSKMSASAALPTIQALPTGTYFVGPDGKTHRRN